MHKIGLRPSVIRRVPSSENPKSILLIVHGGIGDIAMNSSVTQWLKKRYPDVSLALLTDAKYTDAAKLNPDYDTVLSVPPDGKGKRGIWSFGYRELIDYAFSLKPEYDSVILCHACGWNPVVFRLHTLIGMQWYLAGVPPRERCFPRLVIPAEDSEWVTTQFPPGGHPQALLVRHAGNANLGSEANRYWGMLLKKLIKQGYEVFDNTSVSLLPSLNCNFYHCVGSLSIPQVVALAAQVDACVGIRTGMLDAIGFATQTPLYVLYPTTIHSLAARTLLQWASLQDMGVQYVMESECDLDTELAVQQELRKTLEWLNTNITGAVTSG